MFLGIDIGTSSVKCVVTDENGAIMTDSSAALTVSHPHPLWSEQDPQAWWQATVHAVQTLPADLRKNIRAIGLSGQMHGATLLDAAHRPLRPAILWNDGRSGAECAQLEAAEPQARAITGNIVMPGFTAPKLLWVRNHEPDIFRKTAHVLLPKDYIRLRLTGTLATDMSDASGTSWLDVGKRDWSDRMLVATGLTRAHMPTPAEGNAPTGTLTREAAEYLGLPRVIVAAGAGDNAASAVGMGVVAPGDAFLSLGTSGVLFVVTDRFQPNSDKAAHAFCHCLPDRWHQMSVILSAASTLDWVAKLTGNTDIGALAAAAEARGLRRDTPIFLPYLSGERTPHNDPQARGVFFGLSSETSPADLTVAVMEGVAHAFADGLNVLGSEIKTISMAGGGARVAYWGKLLASELGRSLTYRKGGEVGAAYGAAHLARLALTGEAPEAVCVPPPLSHIVEPDAALAALLAERNPLFKNLYIDLNTRFKEFLR
jgi:xylulokinase